ncbi:hypothetical protein Dsin_032198 [Dipteronia sinensis]|uniref:Uncharacterized protein n=1 Tax=Dipteronia sinensis TaxID=43782 RepID=A0AAD9ZN40_9ROSI|nr:hypothetical protein Dsin_032198 [Dipteronia sinensis]
MVHSIRKRRKTVGEQPISDEGGPGGTQSITGAHLKLDNMAWINFHYFLVSLDFSMNEIRVSWNNLSREEKLQYTKPKNDVAEKVHVRGTDNDSNIQSFDTRCTPTRFCQMMSTFSDLQKDTVRALGFGNLLMLNCGYLRLDLCAWLVNKFDTTTSTIELHGKSFILNPSIFSHVMGISDRGDTVNIDGAIHDSWRTKFIITNRGIKLLHLEDLLKNNKTADDDFKVSVSEYTPPAAATDNSEHPKHDIPPDDVLHMILKEILQLRTENADLKHKVDRLYETIILTKDVEDAHLKEKDDILDGKCRTPSWEKESVPTAKDCAVDDVHLPEHNTSPRLIDEDKRTMIAKGYEDESFTSLNSVKKTRTSKTRKPSQYKLSPYQSSLRSRKSSIYWYGHFQLSVPLNAIDAQVIEYVFSEDLPQSETIVSTSQIVVSRSSFRTLEPKVWVDSEISKDGNMKKLLEVHSKFKQQYMYDLHGCELMISLDDVLAMEIQSCFGPSFSFQSFKIVSPEDCPRQPNFYVRGLFVCMFMDGRSDATSRESDAYNVVVVVGSQVE